MKKYNRKMKCRLSSMFFTRIARRNVILVVGFLTIFKHCKTVSSDEIRQLLEIYRSAFRITGANELVKRVSNKQAV